MASGASQTKCLSFYQYVEVYGGPVFDLNTQYAMVLNVVFVTMMYATALPVLLPVAFLNLIVFYSIQVYMLMYVYKKPVQYDQYMNNQFLRTLQLAPVFLLSFGYWELSNIQLLPYADSDLETPREVKPSSRSTTGRTTSIQSTLMTTQDQPFQFMCFSLLTYPTLSSFGFAHTS